MHDVIVVGAGPVGLACAIEARRQGLSALVVDKGTIDRLIVGYPSTSAVSEIVADTGFLYNLTSDSSMERERMTNGQ